MFYSLDDGASVQEVLSEITNQRTVPSIFVNKVHVGGCDRTFQVMIVSCVLECCLFKFCFKKIFKRVGRWFLEVYSFVSFGACKLKSL